MGELDQLAAALDGPLRRHPLRPRGLELLELGRDVDAALIRVAALEELLTRAVLHLAGDREGLRRREAAHDLAAALELLDARADADL